MHESWHGSKKWNAVHLQIPILLPLSSLHFTPFNPECIPWGGLPTYMYVPLYLLYRNLMGMASSAIGALNSGFRSMKSFDFCARAPERAKAPCQEPRPRWTSIRLIHRPGQRRTMQFQDNFQGVLPCWKTKPFQDFHRNMGTFCSFLGWPLALEVRFKVLPRVTQAGMWSPRVSGHGWIHQDYIKWIFLSKLYFSPTFLSRFLLELFEPDLNQWFGHRRGLDHTLTRGLQLPIQLSFLKIPVFDGMKGIGEDKHPSHMPKMIR